MGSVVLLRNGDEGGMERPRTVFEDLNVSKFLFSGPVTGSRFLGGGIGGLGAAIAFEIGRGESTCDIGSLFFNTVEVP